MAYLFTFGIASKFHTEFNTENVVQIGSDMKKYLETNCVQGYIHVFI